MKTADEIVAENTKLTADIAAAQKRETDLTAQIATLNATLTAERETAKASLTKAQTDLAAVTTERDTVRAANVKLEADMKDFEGRVAADVAKKGIKAAESKTEQVIATPKTATDALLAARGVKTLDELAALNKSKK